MEQYSQMSLFDGTQDFKIDKPLRVCELFAGYGSQSLALKYLGVPFEHWKISEWAIKSIQAYKDMHFSGQTYDSSYIDINEIRQWLKGRISVDYSTPLSDDKIDKMPEKDLRTIYENMTITHNLGSVCKIRGGQLNIIDQDKYLYLLTYSFPCQDLSRAGKGAGMQKGSGTRSGLLWEVERILDELNETNQLPNILLMENVPQVHGTGNIESFASWLKKLESLGYKCYWQDLNAKDYGVPQNRDRCFMVSILGDYYYQFPKTQKLEKRLKDVLEDNVDERYYLSGVQTKLSESDNKKYNTTECIDILSKLFDEKINMVDGSFKITNITNNFIQYEREGRLDVECRIWYDWGISPTITTRRGASILNKTHNAQYRIRKLTPNECFRLMGVKDEDYKNIIKYQPISSLYHLAGDSIVVNVIMEIFRKML